MKRLKIDFDHELTRGIGSYNESLGIWWYSRACNASHTRAYRRIAGYLRASVPGSPRLIIDYACGSGNLLSRLGVLFPDSRLMGLDGSKYLLSLARRRLRHSKGCLEKRVRLIETALPRFDFPRVKADLVVFAFPNLVLSDKLRLRPYSGNPDLEGARSLARAVNAEEGDGAGGSVSDLFSLLLGRLVSFNLRALLKRGGLCFRVEYTRAQRDELSEAQLMRSEFEEGSLNTRIDGRLPRQWFRVLASSYIRSRVIEDVDQQSGKKGGMPGGYLITVLRAL